jgi:hypothetical protein
MILKFVQTFRKITFEVFRAILNPALMMSVILFTLGGIIFMDFKSDSLNISNGSFAISIAIAGLCFSYSKALERRKHCRALVVYSGEMFSSASFGFIFISIFKWAYQNLSTVEFMKTSGTLQSLSTVFFTVYVGLLFLLSIMFLYIGLRCIGYVLMSTVLIKSRNPVYQERKYEALLKGFNKIFTA